ncbi:Oidioi.mRNA.OKI2018_I69.chr1.g639.t1.cds [Oikopleura dioica]|uniref:Oidioi.mRNA.OKI2018_I69.chr1.g639.t1.cds n=1 Tax=Oikopleura dioica TaxID=34765 RepID=A0ABN7SRR3_OIKDI|nr:Oidioi.mRNA.OKI2018_I69.chr1.g639.t1.cds [Oikopleura dioica]
MKLFAATLAIASAQDFAASEAGDDARTFSFGDSAFDYGESAYAGFDSGAFYDSAYGSDYNSLSAAYNYDDADAAAADADAAVADEAGRDKDEARYFGVVQATTTSPTTQTFTTTSRITKHCIKCDVMTPAKCAVVGQTNDEVNQPCENGEVCFLEVRRSHQADKLTQICTGCKNAQACWDLKQQNSITGAKALRNLAQCHQMHTSGNRIPRLGSIASVCRTCFAPSTSAYASTSDANKPNQFFAGNSDGNSFTIPNGSGVSATVTLYGSNDATFNDIWFTNRHGLSSTSSYDLDFSLPILS